MIKTVEWKLLWPFYVSKLIETSFGLMGAYFVIYFIAIGLTFFQISALLAVSWATSSLFEIPTGAIADIFGRKRSVLVRNVTTAAILFLLPFTSNFMYLLVLFIIWGITDTLKSGADEAWVTDLLRSEKKEHLLPDYLSKETAIGFFGGIIAPFLAATLLGFMAMKYFWIIQASMLCISFVVLLFAKENFERKTVRFNEHVRNSVSKMRAGLAFSWSHQTVRNLMLAIIFIWFANGILDLAWQPFLTNIGLPIRYLGYVLAAASGLAVLVTLLGGRMAKKIRREHIFLGTLAATQMVFLLLIGVAVAPVVAVAILLGLFVIGPFRSTTERVYFQKFLPSHLRSTITSVRSAVGILGIVCADLAAGALADQIGPQHTIVLSSIVLIPAIVFLLKIKPAIASPTQQESI